MKIDTKQSSTTTQPLPETPRKLHYDIPEKTVRSFSQQEIDERNACLERIHKRSYKIIIAGVVNLGLQAIPRVNPWIIGPLTCSFIAYQVLAAKIDLEQSKAKYRD